MDRFKIQGGRKLEGTVQISGAKNAALPAMAAALLTSDARAPEEYSARARHHHHGEAAGAHALRVESPDLPPSEFIIQAETVSMREAPYELVKTMRASVLTLGPLVARFGYARVSLPGGCAIGARPIDLHIQALEKMGAEIDSRARVRGGAREAALRGTNFAFSENHGDRHGKYFDGGGHWPRARRSWKMRRWSRK